MKKFIITFIVVFIALFALNVPKVGAYSNNKYEEKVEQLETLYKETRGVLRSMRVQDLNSMTLRAEYEFQIKQFNNLKETIAQAKDNEEYFQYSKSKLLTALEEFRIFLKVNNGLILIQKVDRIIESLKTMDLDEQKDKYLNEAQLSSYEAKANLDTYLETKDESFFKNATDKIYEALDYIKKVKMTSY